MSDIDFLQTGPPNMLVFFMDQDTLTWSPEDVSLDHDIASGSISDLLGSGGDFSSADCAGEDLTLELTVSCDATTSIGDGCYYVGRVANGLYDALSDHQAAPRAVTACQD